jgi:hypothetical protein
MVSAISGGENRNSVLATNRQNKRTIKLSPE